MPALEVSSLASVVLPPGEARPAIRIIEPRDLTEVIWGEGAGRPESGWVAVFVTGRGDRDDEGLDRGIDVFLEIAEWVRY